MQLRPYQHEAVASVWDYLRSHDDNPCVVIPTAGGKTPVMATMCREAVTLWHGKVLILAHVKELLEQAADKLRAIAPDVPTGIYSAGLGRRELGYAVTIAGIQSIYKRAADIGAVDLVICDECHLIPFDGEGMYREFIADMRAINPQVRVIGLTATPFRMRGGLICGPEYILNQICYQVGVRELIVQGYLCPLRSKAGSKNPDYDDIQVRGGEYVPGAVEHAMDTEQLVACACREIIEHTKDRKSVLIFAAGVQHGEHVAAELASRGVECGFISGETLTFNRDDTIRRFKAGALKYLANVNVLTTGFDAPNVDCVALLRPTLSPGLYYQMVGRGFRLHPGKADCLVLDFGGNILRHGPVDQIRVDKPRAAGERAGGAAKECPNCHELIAAGYGICPSCNYVFPRDERDKHDRTASDAPILAEVERHTYPVEDVLYCVHKKKGAADDAPRTLRVDYRHGLSMYTSEWICIEHQGWARQKAEAWWAARCNAPCPTTSAEAAQIADAGGLAKPTEITVERQPGDRFDRIVEYQLGPIPDVAETPRLPWGTPSPQLERMLAGARAASGGDCEADPDEMIDVQPHEPCPGCGSLVDRYLQPAGRDWQEFCPCGQMLRFVADEDLMATRNDDIPF